MFKSSLKIAFRSYLRNRKFTVLILLSLVSGLFVAYMGMSYIRFETGFENFHNNSEDIYRLVRTYRSQDYSVIGFPSWSDSSPDEQLTQSNALKSSAGVLDVSQFIISPFSEFIKSGEKQIASAGILSTNTPKGFVNMFTWKPKLGSLENFASGNKKALLTTSSAEKLFGDSYFSNEDVIGRILLVGEEPYILAAIIEDIPANSHFDFEIALSSDRIGYWGSRIYIQVDNSVSLQEVERQLITSFSTFNPRLSQDQLYGGHYLQPIKDIHLNSNLLYESKSPGNKQYIALIGFFAILIILITLFNYANLTLAIKFKAGKSIGVRKAMGAKSRIIAYQFFMEGILLSLVSIPFVAVMVSIFAPSFNVLMGTDIPSNLFEDPWSFLGLIILATIIGFLSSLTPALYLGMRGVVSLFKEDWKQPSYQNFSVRKYMIITQLVILIGITSVSFLISRQLDFVVKKDVGYKKEGVLYAYTSDGITAFFQQKLRQIPGIKAVGSGSSFGIQVFNQGTYQLEGLETVFDDANQLYLDQEGYYAYNIKSTMDTISEGRVTLVNRTAAEKFAKLKGIQPEELIGTQVITEPEYTNEETGESGIPFTIAGIFEDIHLFSLHQRMDPYFLTVQENLVMDGRSIVSYDPENEGEVVAAVNAVYAELNESFPLEIEFLSENLASLYQQDKRTVALVSYFNVIAVFISGIGIIGVTIFLTMARRKEIGIRKVLGASSFSIISSTSKEYVMMVGLSMLIAWPAAYWAAKTWLSNFAYRIDIPQWIFLLVGLSTLCLVFVLVSIVAFRASQENPAKSLKTE